MSRTQDLILGLKEINYIKVYVCMYKHILFNIFYFPSKDLKIISQIQDILNLLFYYKLIQ